MRSILTTMLFFLTVSYTSPLFADSVSDNPYIIKYPFENAIIEYKGKIEYEHAEDKIVYEGEELLYIKGDKILKKTKLEEPVSDGEEIKIDEKMILITPSYVYTADLNEGSGIKIDNPKKYGAAEYEKLSPEEREAFRKRMERRGVISLDLKGLGRKVGTEQLLGKTCDVYENGEKPSVNGLDEIIEGAPPSTFTKSWIWREAGIPLKTTTEQVGYYSELVSTKIDINAGIPDSKFEIPDAIKVVYDEETSQTARSQTLNRFNLYKTGKSGIIKMQTTREVLTPEGEWVPADSAEGEALLSKEKEKPETSSTK